MRSKYGAKKVKTEDGVFDSKREYQRWMELRKMEEAGEITELSRQVPFELIPAQYETAERYGKRGNRLKDTKKLLERAVSYKADFVYLKDGKLVVEDSKGMRTPEYIIKRKLMLYVYKIRVMEV